jgi:predicted NBD/HSP70 family sugar kinase
MRRIHPRDFRIARRSTSREINRWIALNLIREHQPISRADLARKMNTSRGFVGLLVERLIAERLVYEGTKGEAPRGRKPVFLYLRSQGRLIVAVDLRVSGTYLMLCDLGGQQIAVETFSPILSHKKVIGKLAEHIGNLLNRHSRAGHCEGIGVVVPGLVDHETGRVIYAPPLDWRDVDIRDPLSKATGLPVYVESAGRACAMAQMWVNRSDAPGADNFLYVSVSDGVGTGLVIGGELLRGHSEIGGEFAHMPLSLDGPPCVCGATGCWMTYVSNLATVSRYANSGKGAIARLGATLTIDDVIKRARSGDRNALTAIQDTGRYLGLGLVTIIHGVNPAFVYIGGEITAAWDLIEPPMRAALAERALTKQAAKTAIQPTMVDYPRLRGAAALVAAPIFAAPRIT